MDDAGYDPGMSKVELISYNPDWPRRFTEAKSVLQNALGTLAISIDHIGSTSIPGLGSKDRIDIQVTIPEITPEYKERLDERLLESGFGKTRNETDHRPPGDASTEINWKKFYLSGVHPNLNFNTNIHFRAQGMANHNYPLLFRDYLREHPEARDAYFNLKKAIVAYLGEDSEAYTIVKDPGCDLIMVSARAWALKRISDNDHSK